MLSSRRAPQEGLKSAVLPISTASLQAGLAFELLQRKIANGIARLSLPILVARNDFLIPGNFPPAAARILPSA